MKELTQQYKDIATEIGCPCLILKMYKECI